LLSQQLTRHSVGLFLEKPSDLFTTKRQPLNKVEKVKAPQKSEGFGELSIIARTEQTIKAITKQDEVKFPLMETNLPLMAWCL
jgi:hypothetical protein